jgi:hypothetical protein
MHSHFDALRFQRMIVPALLSQLTGFRSGALVRGFGPAEFNLRGIGTTLSGAF